MNAHFKRSQACKRHGMGFELIRSDFTGNEQMPSSVALFVSFAEKVCDHALPLLLTVKAVLCDAACSEPARRSKDWHFVNPFGVAGFEEFNGGVGFGGGFGFHENVYKMYMSVRWGRGHAWPITI